MKPVELQLWASTRCGLREVEAAAGAPVQRVAQALSSMVSLERGWEDDVWLRAGATAGEACIGELVVRVTPQLNVGDLLGLIAWCAAPNLDISHDLVGAGPARPVHLLEALANGVVNSARRLLAGSLHRKWRRREERLLCLRGQPRFERVGMAPAALGLPCRYSELTRDTLLNRLVATACVRAVRVLSVRPLSRQARAVATAWQDLARPIHPDASDFALALEQLDQRTAGYRQTLHLARWLLLGGGPLAIGGGEGVSGWSVNMPALFEQVVGQGLRRDLSKRGVEVRLQASSRWGIRDDDGGSYASFRPDYELRGQGRVVAVIDAKFKNYGGGIDGQPLRKVDAADLYQLAFYGRALGPGVPVIIAYPKAEALQPKYRRIRVADQVVELCGVDLAALVGGRRWCELDFDGFTGGAEATGALSRAVSRATCCAAWCDGAS